MAETIVSPGVLAIENDQSFITQQPVQAGAAIIGPTVKGPVGIPTIVTSYSDYLNKFGSTFLSASQTYSYLTSISAYNYFNNGGTSLLITRVVNGNFSPATSSYVPSSTDSLYVVDGYVDDGYVASTSGTPVFVLETLSEGTIMNSDGMLYANGTLENGTSDNIRWQIVAPNIDNGTFTLIIRQGNDSDLTPSILETFGNLSLDPLANNYIEKVIGNQYETVIEDNGEYYTQLIGDYANKSRYVRVKQVNLTTPNYFDNTGNPKPQYTSSIPLASQGEFGGATGNIVSPTLAGAYFENITNTSIQGLSPSDYTSSISLLSNKEAYKYNILLAPGLIADENFYPDHFPIVSQIVNVVQSRGDSMTVVDLVGYNASLIEVTSNALSFDTSYAATYWPWVQTVDPNSAKQVWLPPSTLIPGVYALNDTVANPWSAPAGTSRGVLSNVIRAERYLTQGNRDTLYKRNVNSIATFANTGVVVFGQKTLQKKQSALDRINVRRLLIELKRYISQIADNLVFEPNNANTRNSFLSQVNPYLASIQQRDGLTDFRVIMDDSNNTATVIDNNQLVGQIYLQPTRTAEFIILDFNILPTGATFPA